ncbi:MAG: hypothetical protein ABI612_10475 [Betaproteobacteria bacterium]
MLRALLSVLLSCCAIGALTAADLVPTVSDYRVAAFFLANGEALPELRLHYRTLGAPTHDETGLITNAVLLLHGADQTGDDFLSHGFADVMFEPGAPLDTQRYFMIVPDDLGSGESSKPSDGLHARFPSYSAMDAVDVQYRLVLDHLAVNHLRLILGNTTGCTEAWLWGRLHPYFADALIAIDCLASQPQLIADATADSAKANAADDAAYRRQALAMTQSAPGLQVVRSEVVAIMSEATLNAERRAILERDIARVKNGRYAIVDTKSGAFAEPEKWRVILPELLEKTEH